MASELFAAYADSFQFMYKEQLFKKGDTYISWRPQHILTTKPGIRYELDETWTNKINKFCPQELMVTKYLYKNSSYFHVFTKVTDASWGTMLALCTFLVIENECIRYEEHCLADDGVFEIQGVESFVKAFDEIREAFYESLLNSNQHRLFALTHEMTKGF